MSCNCKKKIAIEEKHGILEGESILGKGLRYAWRGVIFLMLILIACIMIPILLLIIIFQLSFKKNPNIEVPRFLGKYMR